MKAKTKTQKEVVELSSTLLPFTSEEIAQAQKQFAMVYVGKQTAWCSACGHKWGSDLWERRKKTETCPHCGAKGKVVKSSGKRVSEVSYYVTKIQRVGEWQVLRTAMCKRHTTKEGIMAWEPQFSCEEVYQRWMKKETIDVVIGRGARYGMYCDLWNLGTPWEVRKDHYRYEVEGCRIGKTTLLPELRRNGLKKVRDEICYRDQIFKMLNEAKAEILAKAGQWALLKHMCSHYSDIIAKWDSIRIVCRHGYIVKDSSMWVDMVEFLRKCGKDIRNPHYICPKDLRKAHDEAMRMNERRKAKAEAERLAKTINDPKLQADYEARVGRYFGVMIAGKGIEISPLKTIREVWEEGEAMHHCVFKMGYYKHDHTLLLSARKAGKRLETIELNTESWNVVQSRGLKNQRTKDHDKILDLLKANMNRLRTCVNG